jgi:hypothetical protein
MLQNTRFLVLNMIFHSFAVLTLEISRSILKINVVFPCTHVSADRIINPHPPPVEDIHFLVPPPLEFPHILSEFLASPVEFPQIFIEF